MLNYLIFPIIFIILILIFIHNSYISFKINLHIHESINFLMKNEDIQDNHCQASGLKFSGIYKIQIKLLQYRFYMC